MAAFCQHCGNAIPISAHFCSTCGSVIPAAQPIPGRPLIRPRVGRQIAGVCLAMAQAYAWDVTVVRIIAVLALFFSSGLVGVAYVAAWIGIPEEPLQLPGLVPPAV